MAKKIYKTMQGREIDMESLATQHETMPAVGNAKMNARGDELGPGGKIIRSREQAMSKYYEDNPNAQPREVLKKPKVAQPAPTPKAKTSQEGKKKQ